MSKERLPRKPVEKPAKTERSAKFYGRGDTTGHTWLHGGDPTTKPGYVKGMKGQQKKTQRWPY